MIEAVLRVPGGWRRFRDPVSVLEARHADDVVPVLDEAERWAAEGRVVVGYVAYEAAAAFGLPTMALDGHFARFGVFSDFEPLPELDFPADPVELDWQPEIDDAAYAAQVGLIREAIGAGDTYQVNFTLRLRAEGEVDRRALFAQITGCRRTMFSAFLDFGDEWVACASPELFFTLSGGAIECKPMKGTAPRGRTTAEDALLAQELAASEKNRAENLMITDMVRNDLGRIAQVGSVVTGPLFEVERFATVHQMTSTVRATTDASLAEIFAALFPAASMTGAPKHHTMEIIRGSEASPRGVYAGTIGSVGPGREARFGVAIRTVVGREPALEYGVGGGIVWDSTASDEAAEWRTKAIVLRPTPAFGLVETIRWTPGEGPWLLDRHLARLADSAAYFDFELDEVGIWAAIGELREDGPRRLRLVVEQSGAFTLNAEALPEWPDAIRVGLASAAVNSGNRLLYHKTTLRTHYPPLGEYDELLLFNERGELTEGTFTNVAYRRGDQWCTPPVACGLLAGTFRAELIERGELREERLLVADLVTVDEVRLLNSVRGWSPAILDFGMWILD